MSKVDKLLENVKEECAANVSRAEVQKVLEKAFDGEIDEFFAVFEQNGNGEGLPDDANQSYEEIVNKLALTVDMEQGALQKEWEDHVIDQGGTIVEAEDGTIHRVD